MRHAICANYKRLSDCCAKSANQLAQINLRPLGATNPDMIKQAMAQTHSGCSPRIIAMSNRPRQSHGSPMSRIRCSW
jgi:hypothetical protein